MSRRQSLWAAASVAVVLAFASPAVAARAPVEQTLESYGLSKPQKDGFSFAKRTIVGNVATYTAVRVGNTTADSLMLTVSEADGPGAIASALFTKMVVPGPDGRTMTIGSVLLENPSPGAFKAQLGGISGNLDTTALRASANGFNASTIVLNDLAFSGGSDGAMRIGRIKLDGLAIDKERVAFTAFEVANVRLANPGKETFAFDRFVINGPNDAMTRAFGRLSGASAPSADPAEVLSAFDGVAAKEWRLQGLVVEIPEQKATTPSAAPPSEGATKVSYSQPTPPAPGSDGAGEESAEEPASPRPAPTPPFGPVTFKMGNFAVLDQAGEKIGRFELDGFSVKGNAPYVDTFDVSMGSFAITNLDLGPYIAAAKAGVAAATAKEGQPAPAVPARKTPPDAGLMLGYDDVVLKDFQITAAGMQIDLGSVALTAVRDSRSRIVGYDSSAFAYAFRVTDPSKPYAKMARSTLDTMGYPEILISGPATRTDYLPETDELVFPGGTVTMKDGFAATFAYALLGFRDYYDQTMSMATSGSASTGSVAAVMGALSALKIKRLSMTFEDQSLVGRLANLARPKDGSKSAEEIRASWVKAAEDEARKTKAGSLQRLAATAAANFLRKPNQTLAITLAPPKPLGLADLGGQSPPDPQKIGLSIQVK